MKKVNTIIKIVILNLLVILSMIILAPSKNIDVSAQIEGQNAEDIVKALQDIQPKISESGDRIVMPDVPDGYEVSLYGSDNHQIIGMDENFYQPLTDQSLHIMYEVKNVEDDEDIAQSKEDTIVNVEGLYSQENKDNPKPNVIPGLREWKGYTGQFTFDQSSRVVISSDSDISLDDLEKTLITYIESVAGISLDIVQGDAYQDGDIFIKLDEGIQNLGDEGYLLEITDTIKIEASDFRGVNYAAVTIGQILSQSADHLSLPKGITRDYPKYEIRSGMLDVGRMYIPLDYVQEMTEYMAWFKLNEIQMHINDFRGGPDYAGFRVESKKYPEINASDGYYTQEEYIQYQENMKVYGIDVLTEIDTPYHAESFRAVNPDMMWKKGYLDIRTQEKRDIVYPFIENLFDEFIGDGPNDPNRVFLSPKFHIGTDEYDKKYSEEMRHYTDHFIKYVNEKGYETRLWGSLGKNGFDGDTPVSNEATVNIWAGYWSDVEETYADGYDIVNTTGGNLYIVPMGNAGFPDYLDIESKYDLFETNNFIPSAGKSTKGSAIMPFAHPQTKGSMFALWNDLTAYMGGLSSYDIFDRFKDPIYLVSEKTWFGEKQEDQTAKEFMERVNKLEYTAPLSNPGRKISSKGPMLMEYDFENIDGDIVKDVTGNGHDAKVISDNPNVLKEGRMNFDGETVLELPYESLGFPYTVSFDIFIDSKTTGNAKFSESEDGTLYLNLEDKKEFGFERNEKTSEGSVHKFNNYKFSFMNELPKDDWHNVKIVADNKNTILYIDNQQVSNAVQINNDEFRTGDSNTLVFPLKSIGENLIGQLDNFKIYNDSMDNSLRRNLSSLAAASASSMYDSDKQPGYAIDGDFSTRWGSDYRKTTTDEWYLLEFADPIDLKEIRIHWESARAAEYDILVSSDGETYEKAHSFMADRFESSIDTINIIEDDIKFIKFDLKSSVNKYGFSIWELEIYGDFDDQYGKQVLIEAKEALQLIDENYAGGPEREKLQETITQMEEVYNNDFDLFKYDVAINHLLDAYDHFKKTIIVSENIAPLGIATAQTQYAGDKFTPQNAIDEDLSTRWGSNYRDTETKEEQWFLVTFDDQKIIDQVTVRWENARSQDYTIEVSEDGENFEEVAHYQKKGREPFNNTFNFQPQEVKEVRIQMKDPASNYGFSIYEVEIYNNSQFIDELNDIHRTLKHVDDEFVDLDVKRVLIEAFKNYDAYFLSEQKDNFQYHRSIKSIKEAYTVFKESLILPQEIELDGVPTDIKVGETINLDYYLNPKTSYIHDQTWTSSNEKVVSVSDEGELVGLQEGKTTINLTINQDLFDKEDGLTKTFEIEVLGEEETEEEAKRAAGLVSRMIYRLPNVRVLTVEDAGLVEAARAAYEDLSDQTKGYVTTLGNLELRENRLIALSTESEEVIDEFAVLALQRRIYRLPNARILTLADAAQVEAVRADYEALNNASKEIFSPQYLKNLALREAKLAELESKSAAKEFDRLVAQSKEADELTEE